MRIRWAGRMSKAEAQTIERLRERARELAPRMNAGRGYRFKNAMKAIGKETNPIVLGAAANLLVPGSILWKRIQKRLGELAGEGKKCTE